MIVLRALRFTLTMASASAPQMPLWRPVQIPSAQLDLDKILNSYREQITALQTEHGEAVECQKVRQGQQSSSTDSKLSLWMTKWSSLHRNVSLQEIIPAPERSDAVANQPTGPDTQGMHTGGM